MTSSHSVDTASEATSVGVVVERLLRDRQNREALLTNLSRETLKFRFRYKALNGRVLHMTFHSFLRILLTPLPKWCIFPHERALDEGWNGDFDESVMEHSNFRKFVSHMKRIAARDLHLGITADDSTDSEIASDEVSSTATATNVDLNSSASTYDFDRWSVCPSIGDSLHDFKQRRRVQVEGMRLDEIDSFIDLDLLEMCDLFMGMNSVPHDSELVRGKLKSSFTDSTSLISTQKTSTFESTSTPNLTPSLVSETSSDVLQHSTTSSADSSVSSIYLPTRADQLKEWSEKQSQVFIKMFQSQGNSFTKLRTEADSEISRMLSDVNTKMNRFWYSWEIEEVATNEIVDWRNCSAAQAYLCELLSQLYFLLSFEWCLLDGRDDTSTTVLAAQRVWVPRFFQSMPSIPRSLALSKMCTQHSFTFRNLMVNWLPVSQRHRFAAAYHNSLVKDIQNTFVGRQHWCEAFLSDDTVYPPMLTTAAYQTQKDHDVDFAPCVFTLPLSILLRCIFGLSHIPLQMLQLYNMNSTALLQTLTEDARDSELIDNLFFDFSFANYHTYADPLFAPRLCHLLMRNGGLIPNASMDFEGGVELASGVIPLEPRYVPITHHLCILYRMYYVVSRLLPEFHKCSNVYSNPNNVRDEDFSRHAPYVPDGDYWTSNSVVQSIAYVAQRYLNGHTYLTDYFPFYTGLNKTNRPDYPTNAPFWLDGSIRIPNNERPQPNVHFSLFRVYEFYKNQHNAQGNNSTSSCVCSEYVKSIPIPSNAIEKNSTRSQNNKTVVKTEKMDNSFEQDKSCGPVRPSCHKFKSEQNESHCVCQAAAKSPRFFHHRSLFPHRQLPSLQGLSQGSNLGHCWLVTCVAALSKHGDSSLFDVFEINDQYTPEGVYTLRFFYGGTPFYVTVDSFIPISSRMMTPLYMQSTSYESHWALLLEKGLAKVFGGYGSLDANVMTSGFNLLTNHQFVSYDLETSKENHQNSIIPVANELWDVVTNNLRLGFNSCVSTVSLADVCVENSKNFVNNGGSLFLPHNLVPSHAYAIIGAHSTAQNRYLHLFNPWSAQCTFPQGDYCETMKRRCARPDNQPKGRHGGLWISVSELAKYTSLLVTRVPGIDRCDMQQQCGQWGPLENSFDEVGRFYEHQAFSLQVSQACVVRVCVSILSSAFSSDNTVYGIASSLCVAEEPSENYWSDTLSTVAQNVFNNIILPWHESNNTDGNSECASVMNYENNNNPHPSGNDQDSANWDDVDGLDVDGDEVDVDGEDSDGEDDSLSERAVETMNLERLLTGWVDRVGRNDLRTQINGLQLFDPLPANRYLCNLDSNSAVYDIPMTPGRPVILFPFAEAGVKKCFSIPASDWRTFVRGLHAERQILNIPGHGWALTRFPVRPQSTTRLPDEQSIYHEKPSSMLLKSNTSLDFTLNETCIHRPSFGQPILQSEQFFDMTNINDLLSLPQNSVVKLFRDNLLSLCEESTLLPQRHSNVTTRFTSLLGLPSVSSIASHDSLHSNTIKNQSEFGRIPSFHLRNFTSRSPVPIAHNTRTKPVGVPISFAQHAKRVCPAITKFKTTRGPELNKEIKNNDVVNSLRLPGIVARPSLHKDSDGVDMFNDSEASVSESLEQTRAFGTYSITVSHPSTCTVKLRPIPSFVERINARCTAINLVEKFIELEYV